jgi:hypothetical protein
MKGFEPETGLMEMPPQVNPLEQFTDIQLLLELRRRGVLRRVQASCVVPGYAVRGGFPITRQWETAYELAAVQIHKDNHKPPPGSKVESGRNVNSPGFDTEDRKVTVVLNYVVERPDR